MKESYEKTKLFWKIFSIKKHNWDICGDLKVFALLLGLQFGYTKLCCSLCEWNIGQKTSLFPKTVA